MKRILLTIVLITSSTIGLCSTPSFIEDAFDSIMTNKTSSSGGYDAAKGGAYFGGGISMRTPMYEVTPLQITPPDFRYGCNGMDMTFGSFSFISADELKNLLKAVVSAAPTYAFGLAVDAMCGNCFSMMKALANDVNKMMRSLKNSCEMAKDLVHLTPLDNWRDQRKNTFFGFEQSVNSARSGLAQGWEDFTGTTVGGALFNAPIEGDSNIIHQQGAKTENEYVCETPDAALALSMNTTWEVLKTNEEIFDWFGSLVATGEDKWKAREFMMSMLGTSIFKYVQDTSTSPASCSKESERTEDPALKSFDIFMSTGTYNIFRCDDLAAGTDSKCLSPAKEPGVYTVTIRSVDNLIATYLGEVRTQAATWRADGNSVTGISSAAQKFLEFYPDIMFDIRKSGKHWSQMIKFFEDNSQLLAAEMIYKILKQLYEVMETSIIPHGGDTAQEDAANRIKLKLVGLEVWYEAQYKELSEFRQQRRDIRTWGELETAENIRRRQANR